MTDRTLSSMGFFHSRFPFTNYRIIDKMFTFAQSCIFLYLIWQIPTQVYSIFMISQFVLHRLDSDSSRLVWPVMQLHIHPNLEVENHCMYIDMDVCLSVWLNV